MTLFVAGVFVAYTLALGCGENLYPWPPNTRYEFCNAIDYDVTPIAIAFVPPFIAAIVGFFVPRRVFARVVALLVLSLGVFFVIVIGATA